MAAKKNDHTALNVIIDLGETTDIHPLRKHEVAERVARCFDHLKWHPRTTLSPEVVATDVKDKSITLTLDQPLLTEGVLNEFEVAGPDGRYINARATGHDCQIIIESPVEQPRTVRYAWKNNPIRANVYSNNGLPMSPFQLAIHP